jgi:SH3-like domain-containing protein
MGRTICMALAVTTIALMARADDDFPYEAFVAIDGAEVVSGPGHRYYATARLARGTPVEVYREEASGWLAIRPPEGSFSWTPAEFVERSAEEPKVGRVLEPTPAWIGTAAEHVQEHRQIVTLKQGELVEILGEKQVEGSEGQSETWLRIAPPAGEFRWIHLRDLSRQRPAEEEPTDEEPVIEEPAEQLVSLEEAIEDDDARAELNSRQESDQEEPARIEVSGNAIALTDLVPASRPRSREHAVELAQYRSSTSSPATRPISPDGFVPRKRRGSELLQPTPVPSEYMTRRETPAFSRPRLDPPAYVAQARPSAATPVTASAAPRASVSIDQIADQLEKLDLELSLMLAKDRSTWDLSGLKTKVDRLVEGGSDPVARGRARLLLDKIEQFEEKFDVQSFGPIAAAGNSAASPAAANSQTPSPADPRYDGTGWLKPVISKRGDKPAAPFALVDREGKPVLFVSPAPGLNLNRYVNREVGVYGRRGYIESLKASHVSAERVIDLERVVR